MRRSAAMAVRRYWILAPRHLLVLLCVLSPSGWAKDPATLYMLECQGCHLSDGGGGINSIPALRNSVAKFPAVRGGREYLVQVPGVALSSLSDEDITAVLNWMLTEFGPREWTRRYAPYTVEEVAALRKSPLTEVGNKRAELLVLIERLGEPGVPQ